MGGVCGPWPGVGVGFSRCWREKKKAIAGPTKLANGVGKYFSKKHFFLNFSNKKNSQLILLASQQFLLAKILKTLQFFLNFFWFFAIFFAGFEKKRPSKLVGEPIFFVG